MLPIGLHQVNNSAIWVDLDEAPGLANFVGGFSRFAVQGTLPSGQLPGGSVVRIGGWDIHTLFLGFSAYAGTGRGPTGVLFGNDGSKSLPQSCIESAEHVIRCKAMGRYEAWSSERSTMEKPPEPFVTAQFGNTRVNISTQDLEDKSLLPYANYVWYGQIGVSDGILLAYSQNKKRPRGVWTCHAVAVIGKEVDGQGLIIIDIYANDNLKKTPMMTDWTMSYLTSMTAFSAHYSQCVGGMAGSSLARLIPTTT